MFFWQLYFLIFNYQECRLVHGDFSEYNILLHNAHPYVIDVSQSVEHDNPHSLELLKRDCFHVTRFFRRILEGDHDNDAEHNDIEDNDDNDALSIETCSSSANRMKWIMDMCDVDPTNEKTFKFSSEWTPYSIPVLFEYIVRVDFLQIDEQADWPELDSDIVQDYLDAVATYQQKFNAIPEKEQGKESGATTANLSIGSTLCLDRDKMLRSRARFNCLCSATLSDLSQRFLEVQDVENRRSDETKGSIEEQRFMNTWIPSNLHCVGVAERVLY